MAEADIIHHVASAIYMSAPWSEGIGLTAETRDISWNEVLARPDMQDAYGMAIHQARAALRVMQEPMVNGIQVGVRTMLASALSQGERS